MSAGGDLLVDHFNTSQDICDAMNQMNKCVMSRAIQMLGLLCVVAFAGDAMAQPVPPPNVVWILSEDNSKHYLKHFDETGVATPAIEAMAANGITFDRAFSNAPVCSVARTTLITGCYAPRIGTQYHRRLELATLPEGVEMFPAWLRAAGYYTTNNAKEDYNAKPRARAWDQSSRKASWENRPDKSTPFFHVETHTDSHESRLHFAAKALESKTDFDQESIQLPPYFPDTKLFRHTAAYYRDRMNVIDGKVAATIERLKAAGELENTFVFYFGDHGGVLPRSKGYVYESGLHVPLVVRVPENYRDLVDRELGSRTEGFVSFIDFAPTVLNLAGVDLARIGDIDGTAFLGPGVSAAEVDGRDVAFGYADRMDEKYDLVRSIRIGDWKLIRCFESFQPDSMWADYRYKMLAYQQWKDRFETGKLNALQSQFFQPRQPELMFNLADDPHEVHNLAGDPEHREELLQLRKELTDHLKATNDLSFLTEDGVMAILEAPVKNGGQLSPDIATYIDTVNIALLPWDQASGRLMTAMNSGDVVGRYWAIVAASSLVASDPAIRADMAADDAAVKLIRRRMLDAEGIVASRAAQLSALLELDDPRSTLKRALAESSSVAESLQIFNMARQLNELPGKPFEMNSRLFELPFEPKEKGLIQQHLDHLDLP